MTWPPENTEPTADSAHFCDGEYGPEVLRVSPEGNVYGQMHWVPETEHLVWWTGSGYQYVESTAMWMSESALPLTGDLPHGRIDKVWELIDGKPVWSEFWWDAESQQWKRLRWLWDVDGFSNLPRPGAQAGAAHKVIERHVLYFWDGYQFRRPGHLMLQDDEPDRHLPPGFVQNLPSSGHVEYYSPSELRLVPDSGGAGRVLVNTEWIAAGIEVMVRSAWDAIEWDDTTGTLTVVPLLNSREYWIYLANSDAAFNTAGRDYRGKMFLSRTDDYNGYLGSSGAGSNARLVGKVETDSTVAGDGGPFFRKELDISLISRKVSLPETLREFSDFTFKFVDDETVALVKMPNAYGQIYCAGELVDLGNGYTLKRTDPWVNWIEDVQPKVFIRNDDLDSWQTYHVYMAGDVDSFNFNELNPDTNRPWQGGDEGAAGHYDASLDLRHKLFCSLKMPEDGVLSEEWPGYFTRYVGKINTDSNGKILPMTDGAFRQIQVSDSVYQNVAEVTLIRGDDHHARLVPKRGTNGIIVVAGEPLAITSDGVSLDIRDPIVQYEDGVPALDPLGPHEGQIYIYLTGHYGPWSDIGGVNFSQGLMGASTPPTDGYLGAEWPGNTARYVGLCAFDIGEGSEIVLTGDWNLAGVFDTMPSIWSWNVSGTLDVHGIAVPKGGTLLIHTYVRTDPVAAGGYFTAFATVQSYEGESGVYATIECHNNGTTEQVMQGMGMATITADVDRGYYFNFPGLYRWSPIFGVTVAEGFATVQRILPIV